jgi:carbonic anhydrase
MLLMSAEQVLSELVAGNRRYVAGKATNPHQSPAARQQVVSGQHPMAVVIACADSRVPPEIVFDQGLGDLFVIRVAGNIADDAITGSVEYAAKHLGVPLVAVLGHSRCGAVTAAAQEGHVNGGHLGGLLAAIRPAVERARQLGGDVVEVAARLNAALVAEQLRNSEPVLRWLVEQGRLRIVSAFYRLETGEVEFRETHSALEEYLARREPDYCSLRHMVRCTWQGPGDHTRVADGTLVNATRDNLDYALALLAAGGWEREGRARAVIEAVLTLQDTDPTRPTYGIWPWLLEEPLDAMSPPDWTWADCCGARLAHILADHDDQLGDELRVRLRAALGHAAWSIFRRNAGPACTSIAVMGAGVTLAAGELLAEPRLREYGRARLLRLEESTRQHGGLAEYNSPTYTMVALHECERILQLVGDEEARAVADRLRAGIWESIAAHYHPPTGQWAGPHSRAHSDLLPADVRQELLAAGGVCPSCDAGYADVHHLPCPDHVAGAIARLDGDEVERHHSYVRAPGWSDRRSGTTWMSQEACLGSIDHEDTWTQRRVLLAHWSLAGGEVAVLRLRVLRDGRDFASGCVTQRQTGHCVLTVFGLRRDRGGLHAHLDRPAGGAFRVGDLRARYELQAPQARVEDLGRGRLALCAGSCRAVIYTAAGRFAGKDVAWECGSQAGRAWVDVVWYAGAERDLDPAATAGTLLAAGLELVTAGRRPTDTPVQVTAAGASEQVAVWEPVGQVTAPATAIPVLP